MALTTVIVSHLSRADFVCEHGQTLSYADEIKVAVINLAYEDRTLFREIDSWLALTSLARIVVIFHSEAVAQVAYAHLKLRLRPLVRVSLQENLLAGSDNLQPANVVFPPSPELTSVPTDAPTRTLFRPKLQLNTAQAFEPAPPSPTITLDEA